jgi:hypothetical protein
MGEWNIGRLEGGKVGYIQSPNLPAFQNWVQPEWKLSENS